MNILDENILIEERQRLHHWRVAVRHISYDLGRAGIQDDEIIPFLHQLRRPTFFTRDWDFYERHLCHARYCLVYLNVEKDEVASFVRRRLRHPQFNTEAKRMGTIIRCAHSGISYWRLRSQLEMRIGWDSPNSLTNE